MVTQTATDDALLAAIAADDTGAFHQLTTRYIDKTRRLAFRLTANRQDAEDVAQEVLVTVWTHRHNWRPGEASFSTWIYRVTTNRAIDLRRRRKGESVELSEELVDTDEQSADERVSTHEMQAMILDGFKQLPEKQMLALLYFYYEDMDIPDICLRLRASEDSVRSLLKRGKAGMREVLANRLQTSSATALISRH